MKLEDMKKDMPETPEFIHGMIQREVEKQLQNTAVVPVPKRKMKKWAGARVAAAAVVCLLATSTIAYAGVELYHIVLEKQGAYRVVTGIESQDSAGKLMLPEKIHDIDISAGYIPEGMEWVDEFHLEYPEHDRTGGFSFASALLDDDDLSKVMQDKNVVDCEERTFGQDEGVYLRYHDLAKDGSFNQRVYLLCPEVHRVITVYIGDDISKADALKVVENLKITETDTMIETAGLSTWSEMASPEELDGEEALISVAENQLPIHQIGEAFAIGATGEDSAGRSIIEDNISVCVQSVQVADDLHLISPSCVPEEWRNATGANGKLVKNTLSYVQSGDGINSLDKIVKTERVKQKLVYASVTYTNQSEETIHHMLYLGNLILMNHKDGRYQIYDPAEDFGNGYDHVVWDGVAHTAEMTYSSVSENYGNGGNYISSLKPGESIEVNMAWIVNENDLEHMYLNLNGDGGGYEFSDSILKTGLVDICRPSAEK